MMARFIPFIFVLLWSTGFIGARFGLPYAEPATFLLIRMLANIAIFAVLTLVLKSQLPKGTAFFHCLVTGMLIHGFYLGGTYYAIYLGMPAGLCALLVGLQPIVTAVLLLGQERLAWSQWLGLLLGMLGIALVLQGNMSWQDETHQAAAFGFAGLALLGITLGTLYQKRFCRQVDLVGGSVVQYMMAAAVFMPVMLTAETMMVTWNLTFTLTLTWLVLGVSVTAIWLLLYMVRHGEASKVASTFYLVPPVTALEAWLAFNETFDAFSAIGFAIAAVAVFLVMRKPGQPVFRKKAQVDSQASSTI
ncbi:DMT family transporter [Photobacterium sp. 1_MG-2023]|uniref:DMT family transporter n=1 Tax=Photobacterium sp. 1_MG-2023 TaxID=3062646 RepID=UPI0026E261A5|nr:DMT family transporter [Photobacterium sp. 1_MG-2023]MDO6705610.1 DMT family transporter [Photobacterium sp. 1_MG-2023]